jgi:hypothetical protein
VALEPTTSVPQVPRQRPLPAPWVIPQRFVHRFPAPDDEQGEIDRSEFAIQFFSFILAVITATTLIATFVLVPLVGALLHH